MNATPSSTSALARPLRHVLRSLNAALWLALSTTTVFASSPWPEVGSGTLAPGQSGAKDSALIIGIGDYAFVDDIPGAADSARDWQRWLTRTRGVPTERTVLLVDGDATREDILAEASELAKKTPTTGIFWFIYIGHGAPSNDGKDGILVGADARKTARSLFARSITRTELFEAIEGARTGPGDIVALIDACFSGKSGADTSLAPDLQPVLLADTSPRSRVTTLTAGRSDEFAGPLPELGRPAFSYLMLGAMSGWREADRDGDGHVSLGEAVTYSQGAITAVVRGRRQTPTGDGAMLDVTLVKVGNAGPDLSAIQRDLSEHGNTANDNPIDISKLDLQSLKEAEVLSQSIKRAISTESDNSKTPREKAEAWEAVARLSINGDNPFAEEARQKASAWRKSEEKQHETGSSQAKTGTPRGYVRIEAGSFMMGSPTSEWGRDEDEIQRMVTISRPFWLKVTEVTQAEWRDVMGTNPSWLTAIGPEGPRPRRKLVRGIGLFEHTLDPGGPAELL